jgi:hypothetical protein
MKMSLTIAALASLLVVASWYVLPVAAEAG